MPMRITTSTVIPAGQVYDLQYSSTEYEGGHGIVLSSNEYGSFPIFANSGTLRFAAPVTSDRPSLIFATSSGAWWDGTMLNYGSMYVSGGNGVSLLWAGWTPSVINSGTMTVEGVTVGVIKGDHVKDQGEARPSVDNRGEIQANGSTSASGIYFSYASTILNSGSIKVTVLAGGTGEASAIRVGDDSVIRNSGQIVAEDNNASATRSTAIGFSGSDGPMLIVNTGLIKADTAILEYNLPREYTGYATSRVENYKDIVGKIQLGMGDDTVVNRGMIAGDVELGDQNDLYDGVGGSVSGVVRGGAGADRFLAGLGVTRIEGGAGDDVLAPGAGETAFDGGAGFDTVDFSGLSTGVTFSLALTTTQALGGGASLQASNVEALVGTRFVDQLTAAATGSTLNGGEGDDVLTGGAGVDILIGGKGADTLRGGGGSDTFVVKSGDGADTIVDFDVTQDWIDASAWGGSTSATYTQDSADAIVTFSATDSLRLVGVQASAVAGRVKLLDLTPRTIIGGPGADTLTGGNGNDIIRGGAGNDVLDGGYGDDLLEGGPGYNRLYGGEGRDTASYESASNYVFVILNKSGSYTNSNAGWSEDLYSIENVIGSAYDDFVVAGEGSGNNRVDGGAGNDNLAGGEGDDQLYGGVGNDVLSGGDGDDLIDGGAGVDRVDYTDAKAGVRVDLGKTGPQDTVSAGVDTITGVENIRGSAFNDTLTGDANANVFEGWGGADIIDGSGGIDTVKLSGAFANYTLTAQASGGVVIQGRTSAERLVLSNVEIATFSDRSVALTLELGSVGGVAIASILRVSAAAPSQRALVTDVLNATFASASSAEIVGKVVQAAGATTSVASMSYQFFTGKIPGQGGVDYLVSPTGANPNNLNSAYYQSFNLENRYINFAVNLGKNGEGKDAFAAKYGSLSLFDATREAYKTIFGGAPVDAKVHTLIDSRVDYFASYGGDGPAGIGTKAAMVGWLLAEAQKADLGVMARANDAWLADLGDGAAPYAVNLLDPTNGYYKAEYIFSG